MTDGELSSSISNTQAPSLVNQPVHETSMHCMTEYCNFNSIPTYTFVLITMNYSLLTTRQVHQFIVSISVSVSSHHLDRLADEWCTDVWAGCHCQSL